MSEHGASSTSGDIDDPGRDPVGLDPPRNVIFGGTQDSGQGHPRGEGNVGPGDKPEPPTEEPEDTRADTPDTH